MIVRSRKLIPVALCGIVLAVVLAINYLGLRFEDVGVFGIVRRLESITYDWRVRAAAGREASTASNLGLVYIDNSSIWYLASGLGGYSEEHRIRERLHWPRYIYGQLVQELTRQGVDVVGFDVLMGNLHPRTLAVMLPDGSSQISDEYFKEQLASSGRVVLAAQNELVPPAVFRTNAWAIGDIGTTRDADGAIRRTKAFEDYVILEPILQEAQEVIDNISVDTNRVVFPGDGQSPEVIPVDADGYFDKARLIELVNGVRLPDGPHRRGLAFKRVRVWDLGLTMAAHYLGIDLAAAEIVTGSHIALRGTNSVRRTIPIDDKNRFRIDWSFDARDPRIARESFHSLLDRHYKHTAGQETGDNLWRGRVALVGSLATGNDLTDLGATPLAEESYLTMRYLNVANSMLVNRFVREPSYPLQMALILSLGLLSGILTWNLRANFAALFVLLLAVAYAALALHLYIANRYSLPLVLPLGGLLSVHMSLVSYRVVVEQKERRRIRGIFAKIVSPNVVNELLQAERLEFGGTRREITMFFSDIRGFTEMTDESHARAEEYVKAHNLAPAMAKDYFDQQAQELLQTVNLYLGTIADVIKRSEGTLDKYIGDCVMAFWGAPTPNDRHAVSCVRAAIEAQGAIDSLNRQRAAENARRERENAQPSGPAAPPLPPLKLLTMGVGINTGIVTLGLMGSERHVYNYTVFGREVNLAARLEGLSGSGRILIGEATHRLLLRDDPALAAGCRELPPATIKGFRTPVKFYEVPWTNAPSPGLLPSRADQPVDHPPIAAP